MAKASLVLDPKKHRLKRFMRLADKLRNHHLVERGTAPMTAYRARLYIHRFVYWLQEVAKLNLGPSQVDRELMLRFFQWCKEELHYGPTSMAGVTGCLRYLFAWLTETGRLRASPLDGYLLPKVPLGIPRPLEQQTISNLLVAPDSGTFLGRRDLAILEIIYGSGLRLFEALKVKFEDFLFDPDLGPQIRVLGKGKRERQVPLSPQSILALNHYLQLRGTGKPEDPLFTDELGRGPIPTPTFHRRMWRYRELIGNLEVGALRLRHSFATHSLSNGMSVYLLKVLLGHVSIRTTTVYTKATNGFVQDQYNQSNHRSRLPEPEGKDDHV